MEKVNFCLNVKSAYTMLSSLIKIDNYIEFAKKCGFSTLCLIDHNVMHGCYEFYKKCLANKIKPIIGLSFFVTTKQNNQELLCSLIANDEKGYRNLISLSSLLMTSNQKNIDLNDLKSFVSNNVLVVNIDKNNHQQILNDVRFDDAYLGVSLNDMTFFDKFFQEMPLLRNRALWFDSVNYFEQKDEEAYKLLLSVKQQKSFLDVVWEPGTHLTIGCDAIPQFLIENNLRLIASCDVIISKQDFKQTLLRYPTPNGVSAKSYLSGLCEAGWKRRFKGQLSLETVSAYKSRLAYELEVIDKMGFNDYFLIVYDYVNKARMLNIYVGPGRGSAAGSFVSYLLHITEVNPLTYDLLFERFLNPERKSMPDIDIDFEDINRDKIVEYLFEKYGAQHVAHIVTYQTVGLKMALRDLCRATGVDIAEADKMSKLVDPQFNFLAKQAIEASAQLQLYAQKYDFIFKNIDHFIGLPRQVGTHAAGIVLSQEELTSIVPIQDGYNGIFQTQYSMEHLEELGLIKFDLLGLRNLTILHNIVDDVNQTRHTPLLLSDIALDDQPTYKLLGEGETQGIFQLESPGMTNVLVKMKASNLMDIAATSSLFRPGPQENIPAYIRRKSNEEQVSYPDDRLHDILAPTYGIIVYQEQVMLIAQKVANFSLAKADILRRAMGKKDYNTMNSVKDEFLNGAQDNGYDQVKALEIWNLIDRFASYGFNKSHAVCYSLIGYWMAYFKANYSSSFISALLTSVIGDEVKTNIYLQEAKKRGLQIVPPNINRPDLAYHGDIQLIYVPLLVIKQIGYVFFKQICLDVKEKKEYKSLLDVFLRLSKKGLNKKTYEALCYAGALDDFKINRTSLFLNFDVLSRYIDVISYQKDGQLFFDQELSAPPPMRLVKEDEIVVINKEREFLGFYLHDHPVGYLRRYLHLENRTMPIGAIENSKVNVNVMGSITRVKVIHDKKQQQMAFVDLQDESGAIDVTCFHDMYGQYQNIIVAGNVVLMNIRLEMYKQKIKGVLLRIKKLEYEE